MDLAASEMWDPSKEMYVYQREGVERSTGEQVDFVEEIIDNYGFFFVEDPIREDDLMDSQNLPVKLEKNASSVEMTFL